MATIDLGKIVYTWKGDYDGAAAYVKFDTVRHQNNVYICIQDAAAGIDPSDAGYWNLMTEGTDTPGKLSGQTAGEALSAGDHIYQDIHNQRGGGITGWYKVDPGAANPVKISSRRGIALTAAAASGDTFTVQHGEGVVGVMSGLTPGARCYAGADGALTETEPPIPAAGSQTAQCLVGYAVSATELHFKPDEAVRFTLNVQDLADFGYATIEHWPDEGALDRTPRAYYLSPYGPDVTVVGVDPGTAIASSYHGSNADKPERPFRRNPGAWESLRPNCNGEWLEWDFGAGNERTVRRLMFQHYGYEYYAGNSNIKIQYDTGASGWVDWHTLTAGVDYQNDSDIYTKDIELSDVGPIRKFRFITSGTPTNSGYGFYIIVVHAFEAGMTRQEPVALGSEKQYTIGTPPKYVGSLIGDENQVSQDIKTSFRNYTENSGDFVFEVELS